jgi:CRISPR/Cas system-associated exonuclease Cas4 (RecB family)
MVPVHFTVTQIRSAAACPRVLYFDVAQGRILGLPQPTTSRIWKSGQDEETTACGALFHTAVEHFNGQAARGPAVHALLTTSGDSETLAQGLLALIYRNHVKRETLFQKSAVQQEAFLAALRRYVGELADILAHARACGKTVDEVLEEMFADRRRRVDVTFQVGSAGEEVHVSGLLDYVFYDWRTAHHRIIDYKLTPADRPADDLFQVCLYALMHHVQHGTQPDVGVLYLHPNRQMIEKSWEQVYDERHVVYNLLASMHAWVRFDEARGEGMKPPGEPLYCKVCRWQKECISRLGPKHEGKRLMVWTPATTGAPQTEPAITVRPPVPEELQQSIGGAGDLADAATPTALTEVDALWLGQGVENRRLVRLPCAILPTHMAVVGAAGSGKTWLAKVLVEEAIVQGVPVLAIDPQGDLVQFLKRRDPSTFPREQLPRYEQFWRLAEARVFTPGSSQGTRLCLSPIRLPRLEELGSLPDARRREELDGLLSAVAGNLVNAARASGDTDCQRTFVFQLLRHLTDVRPNEALGLADVVEATVEPETVGMENADRFIKKGEREKLARKLQALLFGPSASLFSGGQPLDLGQLLRPRETGKVPLNVIYLNALPDDEQKQLFVAALAAEVYRWMVTEGSGGAKPQVLVYLDEARDYIPAGARKPPAKDPLVRLFAQGRKYGVACLICTQSPRSVDYNIFGNCSTKVIGRLESSQDVERVAEWFGKEGPAPFWLQDRKGAEAGTFVGRWPGHSAEWEGRAWKSRCLFSWHEGAWSPERLEQEIRLMPSYAVK